ncbi:hypothetical protein COOONC_21090 [Cooperia oncophora]
MSMELLNEVERLDELVRNTTATYKGQIVHFSDLHKVDINYIFHSGTSTLTSGRTLFPTSICRSQSGERWGTNSS